jgi:hypothetical protein
MLSIPNHKRNWLLPGVGSGLLIAALCFPALVSAQDRDWHDRHDGDRERMTRIEAGTTIPVRVNQTIDVDAQNYQGGSYDDQGYFNNPVYTGTVEQDIVGENGRLAIPAGSQVNLAVRVARDNDLVLDINSVNVNGQVYSLPTRPDRLQSRQDQDNVIGNIVGAVTGNEVRGRAVRVHRGTVLTFQLNRPMEMRAQPRY